MAESKTKKYRRPDGSTYSQYGGPKSAQDVEVSESPAPGASPSPSPTPGAPSKTIRQTASGARTSQEHVDRAAAVAADEATARAKATEVIAPWLGKKPEQQEGGLGGAAARAKQKKMDMPADAAGDAMAEDNDKKKKKKE